MKKFSSKNKSSYFTEDLTAVSSEPQSPAATQAKRLGLTYVGFGRYEDIKTRQVTHIVQNDRLVPFSKAVRTNSYAQSSGNDIGDYVKSLKQNVQQSHQELSVAYKPEKYSEDELDAIKMFTENAAAVNGFLANLPTGIEARDIQPTGTGDNTPQVIASLDSALDKSKTPTNILTYSILPTDMEIKPGNAFSFKGYRSSSIDLGVVLAASEGNKTLLQTLVSKGTKGMYVDDYSANPGEAEFIAPRSSVVTITGGPSRLRGSVDGQDTEITYYTSELTNK
jgi:hypothetical protein